MGVVRHAPKEGLLVEGELPSFAQVLSPFLVPFICSMMSHSPCARVELRKTRVGQGAAGGFLQCRWWCDKWPGKAKANDVLWLLLPAVTQCPLPCTFVLSAHAVAALVPVLNLPRDQDRGSQAGFKLNVDPSTSTVPTAL